MIPASELTQLQSDAAALLDKVAVIERKTTALDGYGTETETYSQINVVAAGMAIPNAGELTNFDYAIGDKASWKVRLPYGTDVQVDDHLLIEGQTLEVHILLTPQSYAVFTNVIAIEIK